MQLYRTSYSVRSAYYRQLRFLDEEVSRFRVVLGRSLLAQLAKLPETLHSARRYHQFMSRKATQSSR